MVKNHPTKFVYSLALVLSFCFLGAAVVQRNKTVTVKVGAVLDLGAGTVGEIGLSCIKMSLSHFYLSHSHYKTRLQLIIRDSQRDVVTAAAQGNSPLYSLLCLCGHVSACYSFNVFMYLRHIVCVCVCVCTDL